MKLSSKHIHRVIHTLLFDSWPLYIFDKHHKWVRWHIRFIMQRVSEIIFLLYELYQACVCQTIFIVMPNGGHTGQSSGLVNKVYGIFHLYWTIQDYQQLWEVTSKLAHDITGHGSVSNHQPYDCLLSRLFRRRSKKASQLRVNGLCAGNSPVTGEFPTQMASNAEMFPFDEVIMDHSRFVFLWLYHKMGMSSDSPFVNMDSL